MGGAESTDKENRTIGINWWSQEVPSYADMDKALDSLENHDWKVDYIISHNCPERVGMRFITEHNAQGLYNTKINDPVSNFLQYVVEKAEFKHLYYGHWHEDWTWDKYTLLYQNVKEIRS